jgi:hypothetical protein
MSFSHALNLNKFVISHLNYTYLPEQKKIWKFCADKEKQNKKSGLIKYIEDKLNI